MTAKEYLQSAKDCDHQILTNIIEMHSHRARAERATAAPFKEQKTDSESRTPDSKMGSAILEIESLRESNLRELHKYLHTHSEIKDKINAAVKKPEERTVLLLHYICGFNMTQVADIMNYSYKQAIRIHRRALECFAKKHGFTHID